MKKSFFKLLVATLLVIIFFLIGYILIRHRQEIITLKRDSVVSTPRHELKFFYELKPGHFEIFENPSWLVPTPKYTINSDTLNERFNYSTTKTRESYRIITLGDSFTFGLFVNTWDNWTELLENQLNKTNLCKKYKRYEVINLGVPGYDVRYSAERFLQRGQKYEPDLVIWFLRDEDFSQIQNAQLQKFEEFQKDQLRKEKNVSLNELSKFPRTDFRKEVNKIYGRTYIENYQKKALQRFNQIYTGNLLIYTEKKLLSEDLVDSKNILANYVKKRKATKLFSSDLYLKIGSEIFEENFHPNQTGHKLIANDIYRYMQRNNIICQ